MIVFFFLFWFILFGVFIFILSSSQKRQARKVLASLKDVKLNTLNISYSIQTTSKFRITGGLSIKANLYYSDDFILVCPNRKSVFNALVVPRLPIAFAENRSGIRKINSVLVVKPERVSISSWHSLIIEHTNTDWINVKRLHQIRALNKSQNYILTQIKNNLTS